MLGQRPVGKRAGQQASPVAPKSGTRLECARLDPPSAPITGARTAAFDPFATLPFDANSGPMVSTGKEAVAELPASRSFVSHSLGLGDHGDRDLQSWDTHGQLGALSRRRIDRKPLQPFFIGIGEIFLVGHNQRSANGFL